MIKCREQTWYFWGKDSVNTSKKGLPTIVVAWHADESILMYDIWASGSELHVVQTRESRLWWKCPSVSVLFVNAIRRFSLSSICYTALSFVDTFWRVCWKMSETKEEYKKKFQFDCRIGILDITCDDQFLLDYWRSWKFFFILGACT